MFPIAYFIIGGLLYKKKAEVKIRKYWLFCILMGAMLILTVYGYLCTEAIGTGEWYNVAGNSYSSILVVTSTICIFFLFKDIQLKNKYVIRYFGVLGRNTLGIYFTHIPIGYSLNRLLRRNFRINYCGLFYTIIFSLIVLNLALLLTIIFKEIRKFIFVKINGRRNKYSGSGCAEHIHTN